MTREITILCQRCFAMDAGAMTSSPSVTSDVGRVLRLSRTKTRYFSSLPWRQRDTDTMNADNSEKNSSENTTKISDGFLKNIKKKLRIQNLSLCKAKQKVSRRHSECREQNFSN